MKTAATISMVTNRRRPRHAKVILSRLKLPKQLQKDVVKLIPDHDTFFRPAYQSLYRILVQKGYTKALFEKLMDLQEADIEAHASQGPTRTP